MIDEKMLELNERKTDERESTAVSCVVFDLNQIQDNFHNSLQTINNNLSKAKELEEEGKNEIAEDMYRFLVASLESSFDYFVHCVVKLGFKEIYLQERNPTEEYKKFSIPLSVVMNLLSDTANPDPLTDYVNERTSTVTYLSYTKLKEAFSLIDGTLLSSVIDELYPNSEHHDLKSFIDDIYARRNLIVHQDDRENTTGEKVSINYSDVEKYKNELVQLVECIIKHLQGKI